MSVSFSHARHDVPMHDVSATARWYLAIDLGTGGCKVAAVDAGGDILASAFRSIDTEQTDDGGHEQDTDQWWNGVVEAAREVVSAVDRSRCAGLGITGQWGSTVPIGADGQAVGRCLMWFDHRGAKWSSRITGGRVNVSGYGPIKIAKWLRRAGGAPNPNGADPTGHALFLRHARPHVHDSAAALIEPVDFIGLRLTGRVAATPASMVASWLTDNRAGAPVAYDDALVAMAERDSTKLPELLPTGAVLGHVRREIADDLGLPHGTPVVCGVPDVHTAAIGAGAVADFAGHIAFSTSAWVSAPVPFKKTDVLHQMASVPGLRAGSYLIANNHETGGAALRWLRDSVVDGRGYDDLTAEACTSEAGS